MAKNLGRVALNDDEALLTIVAENMPGREDYFQTVEVWNEAITYMEENDSGAAEVRINNLDYVMVEKDLTN